ncbi:MAG: flagellum-specific ATP synthase FliI, partial [Desulfobacteraceae bacterium]|nr:flagellum-specific ATP synthase FliI [Desulfobacteraceae bacterium]
MISDAVHEIDFNKYFKQVEDSVLVRPEGRISKIIGLVAESDSLGLGVGSLCLIKGDYGKEIKAEVIGFKENKALLMPYGDIRGISPGSRIVPLSDAPVVKVGDKLLGRVIDGMENPIDGKGELGLTKEYPLYGKPMNPMERKQIKESVDVGVKTINTMMTLGRGQRVCIMSGSGVGKSMLMGMITKHTEADVVVIGLIGERGREVKDFVEETLGEKGLEKAVVVAATSDSPPLVRMRGAYVA